MKQFLENKILHPFLFAAFPVLFLYAENVNMVSVGQVWAPLGLLLLFAGITLILSWLIFRSWYKAAIFTSGFVLLFFLYRSIFSFFEHFTETFTFPLIRQRYLVLAIILIPIFFAFWLSSSENRNKKSNYALNIMACFLLFPSLFKLIYATSVNIQNTPKKTEQIIGLPTASDQTPDIFYFILDGYPRQDILKTVYNFDNAYFIDSLQKRGFYIAHNSTSNYCWTKLSITSSLNYNYLSDIPDFANAPDKENFPLKNLVENSAIRRKLEQHHYKYISFGTGFEVTEVETADYYFTHPFAFSEFTSTLFNATFLPYVFQNYLSGFFYQSHRETLNTPFNRLDEVLNINSPKFVQIHLLSPHPPFVFDRNGNPVQPNRPFALIDGQGFVKNASEKEYKDGLTDQITFLNNQLLNAVNKIQSHSERPAIILLQGDHGARLHIDEKVEKTALLETFANISAFYLPNKQYAALYPAITPVNSFRIILNEYFNEKLPLLKDKNLFCAADKISEPIDVTEEISIESKITENIISSSITE